MDADFILFSIELVDWRIDEVDGEFLISLSNSCIMHEVFELIL